MEDSYIEKFYDEILCKDIRVLVEILGSLSTSYRQLVGAADEFNRISLVHRHEAEEAIDRADDLGDIIDDVDRELKKLIKLYLREMVCKIEIQKLYNNKLTILDISKTTTGELIEDLDEK